MHIGPVMFVTIHYRSTQDILTQHGLEPRNQLREVQLLKLP